MPCFEPVLARLVASSPSAMGPVVVLGVVLIAIAAQITIPFEPVPMTLQSYVILTLAALMGWRLGGLTIAAYVALGLSGLHIFAGGRAGLAVLTGTSGGYVAGFVAAMLLVGWLQATWARGRALPLAATLVGGHLLLMLMGAAWLARGHGAAFALEKAFLPFLPGAALKTAVAMVTVLLVERLTRPAPLP